MGTPTLRSLLQEWFRAEREQAPEDDPRHTAACLRFAELGECARQALHLSPDRAAHVEQCAWCQRTLALYRGRGPFEIASAPPGEWAAGLNEFVSDWVTETVIPERDEGNG